MRSRRLYETDDLTSTTLVGEDLPRTKRRRRRSVSNTDTISESGSHYYGYTAAAGSSSTDTATATGTEDGTEAIMRLTQPSDDLDAESNTSDLQNMMSNGASSVLDNGHVKGLSNGSTNGSAANRSLSPRLEPSVDRLSKHSTAIARVNLPGTALYPGSATNREEFVRLVIQTLKDVGYVATAATLEEESGFSFETARVAAFRSSVMDGDWSTAERGLSVLGVRDEDGLRAARFLISQQKYLECLEAGRSADALFILRQEIAPMDLEPARLHNLSSLIMSSTPEELRRRASWDGARGESRQRLLAQLQQFVPSSTMVPPRRLDTLLQQARQHQIDLCNHHVNVQETSLYHDHICSRNQFPSTTTHILAGHTDEVWQVQWSHSGKMLASSSRDMSVIIWRTNRAYEGAELECTLERVLRGHCFTINAIAWSLDDKLLLSSAEHEIKLWDVESGICVKTMLDHSHTVNGLCWMADGSGFVTGGMDRRIMQWDNHGVLTAVWPILDIRILELAITPDGTKLVAIGQLAQPATTSADHVSNVFTNATIIQASGGAMPAVASTESNGNSKDMERRIAVYDVETRQEIWAQPIMGELQSVKLSDDSRFALINHRQGDVMLWDLEEARLTQRYFGRPKGACVVRNCFGGDNANFVMSGSEDGHIYVWHRRTGTLFEILAGHGPGGVNSVDWCPGEDAIFASCGDDGTIRIWGPEPTSGRDGLVEKSRKTRDGLSGDFDNERPTNNSTSEDHRSSSPTRTKATLPR